MPNHHSPLELYEDFFDHSINYNIAKETYQWVNGDIASVSLIWVNDKPKVSNHHHHHHHQWVSGDIAAISSIWVNDKPTIPNHHSPLELYKDFFDDSIFNLMELDSHRYAINHNRPANITKEELKIFVGVLILNDYILLPCRRLYW